MRGIRRAGLCLAVALALLLAAPSLASGAEEVVQDRHLHLVSSMSEGADRLSPGADALWTVRISASGVEEGRIDRTLVVDGALAPAVRVSVESCAAPPTAGECPGATVLLDGLTPTAGRRIDLGAQDAAEVAWLRVRVTLSPQAPDETQALAGSLRLEVQGLGEDVSAALPGTDGGTGSGETGSGGTGSGPAGSGTAVGPASTTSEGSAGADASAGTGTSSEAATSDRGDGGAQGTVAHGLPGPLAVTGSEPLPWMLAAAALVLIGVRLLRGRKE